MSDEKAATAAKLEARAIEIEEHARNLTVEIKEYILAVKSTGIKTPPPPRPNLDIVKATLDALHLLDLYIRVIGVSQKM